MQAAVEKKVFQLCGGHPALDLVNTVDWRFRRNGPEELLTSYEDLLDFALQSGALTQKEARRLVHGPDSARSRALSNVRAMREAASELLYALLDKRKPAAAALATLDASFKSANGHRALVNTADGPRWAWTETTPELPAWRLALSLEELLTSEQLRMVRACADPACRWLFLDTSRNHSRRWCEMSICGNRMKARRFKQQQRRTGSNA